jgi:Tfp pilus assembly protein PilP
MRLLAFVAFTLTLATAVNGQTAKPAAAPRPAMTAVQAEQPTAPEPYTYQSDARRDPFLSLTGTGTELHAGSNKREGPAGMTVAEIAVRGVLQSRGTLVAMVSGPDHKTYVVHAGDKLLDGTIKSITPQGMIFSQDVNDPLSLVKQREVSKLLHAAEGKE